MTGAGRGGGRATGRAGWRRMVTIDNGRDQSMQSLDITAGLGGDKGVSVLK